MNTVRFVESLLKKQYPQAAHAFKLGARTIAVEIDKLGLVPARRKPNNSKYLEVTAL